MKILEKQGYHLFSILVLVGGIWLAARGDILEGSFLGLSTRTWLILSVLFPILHQIYVVIFWRGELYYGWLSKTLGERAFTAWAVGFMILFLARPITIFALAIANHGTLAIPVWINIPLIGICLGIVAYMAYSFIKYFDAERALGMDHFKPDEYRELPFVREGIFKWSSNAMYAYAFLALWMIGLIFNSKAALLAALFNHLYIWAHYYFTEHPDMQYIYRDK
ncbi:MAG: hypothetical protein KAH12_02280 [Anaerolineales bacterium]|nr:hypothetical protein [Anaerolineales bacterium]